MPEEPEIRPSVARQIAIWSAHRRRPAFLLILLAGVALALVWLPAETRLSLWKKLSDQRVLLSLIFLFAMLALSLIWSVGQIWDAKVFMLFNRRGYPQWLDRFMLVLSQLGNALTAFIIALLFFFMGFGRQAVEIILGTLTLWVVVETIKALAERDRPFITFEDARVIGWREKGDSFPSGHTTQAFFLATLLVLRFNPSLEANLALYAIATIVGFTRIYVGAHYPRDVLGGAVLGSIGGILALIINPA